MMSMNMHVVTDKVSVTLPENQDNSVDALLMAALAKRVMQTMRN